MKKLFIAVIASMSMSFNAVAAPSSASDTIKVEMVKQTRNTDPRANATPTKVYTDISGQSVQVWLTNKNQRAFVILVSKTKGTEYRRYLGEEMTQKVKAALSK